MGKITPFKCYFLTIPSTIFSFTILLIAKQAGNMLSASCDTGISPCFKGFVEWALLALISYLGSIIILFFLFRKNGIIHGEYSIIQGSLWYFWFASILSGSTPFFMMDLYNILVINAIIGYPLAFGSALVIAECVAPKIKFVRYWIASVGLWLLISSLILVLTALPLPI